MRRVSLGVWILLAVALLTSVAEARPNKRRGRRAKKKGAPTSEAINKAMGELKWGMDQETLVVTLADDIKEQYRPQVQKTKDPIEKDRLRTEFQKEIKRLKDSYVKFDGSSTGWDASFLKGEFSHRNGESMMVRRDGNSQNFYFFMNGRLWKWYKAFDAAAFPAKNFGQFSTVVQKRFGPGQEGEGQVGQESANRRYVEWEDKKTRLRAIDQTEFYGFYGLVFEERSTLASLDRLRKDRGGGDSKKSHALIDAVTGDDDPTSADQPNIVDRLTGKMRNREERQAEPARSAKAKGGRGGRSQEAEADEPAPVKTTDRSVDVSDDPLEGIL